VVSFRREQIRFPGGQAARDVFLDEKNSFDNADISAVRTSAACSWPF
jgi:hypothetical protein